MYEARFARATPVKVMPADAGFSVALAYPRDVYHRRVFKALRKRRDEELDTTGLVLTETVRLIGRRYAESGALQFLTNVAVGAGQMVNVPSDALGHLRAFAQ
jgi:predicted nucleic acid-binding protein